MMRLIFVVQRVAPGTVLIVGRAARSETIVGGWRLLFFGVLTSENESNVSLDPSASHRQFVYLVLWVAVTA